MHFQVRGTSCKCIKVEDVAQVEAAEGKTRGKPVPEEKVIKIA